MSDRELHHHVRKLEQAFNLAAPSQRVEMRPGIERIIETLKSGDQPIPSPLRRIEERLNFDQDEDFFDNMPV